MVEFRQSVRSWLAENVPADWRKSMTGADEAAFADFQRWWFGRLLEAGFALPHWPKQWGGADWSLDQQVVFYEEVARADAPRTTLFFISLYHVPATLLEWGSEAQKSRYLPGVAQGDVWCQGFSEPNAGSDLASLRTSAVSKGDHYVVNGQKIWSSLAQFARYCLLLARTDKAAPKHRGISYFILDMRSEGVTTKPIRQMTGVSEFNEIFLDDVRIPAENLIGEENQGWLIAQTTLASERGLTVLELSERMAIALEQLIEQANAQGKCLQDAQFRRRLVDLHTDVQSLRLLVKQQLDRARRSESLGVEATMIKLHYTRCLRRFTELQVALEGIESQHYQPGLLGGGQQTGNPMFDYLSSWMWSIAGGSNEVIRNLIAERGLNLPRFKGTGKG